MMWAFTLVEILVVLAIISILLALLQPALLKSKDQARSVQCVNNLRQIGVAGQTYAAESDGYMLPPHDYNNQVNNRSSLYGLLEFGYLKAGRATKASVASATNQCDIFICPQLQKDFKNDIDPRNYTIVPNVEFNYSVSALVGYWHFGSQVWWNQTNRAYGPYKIDEIKFPDKTFLAGDALVVLYPTPVGGYNQGCLALNYKGINGAVGNRQFNATLNTKGTITHGGPNILWYDGHVSRWQYTNNAVGTIQFPNNLMSSDGNP